MRSKNKMCDVKRHKSNRSDYWCAVRATQVVDETMLRGTHLRLCSSPLVSPLFALVFGLSLIYRKLYFLWHFLPTNLLNWKSTELFINAFVLNISAIILSEIALNLCWVWLWVPPMAVQHMALWADSRSNGTQSGLSCCLWPTVSPQIK